MGGTEVEARVECETLSVDEPGDVRMFKVEEQLKLFTVENFTYPLLQLHDLPRDPGPLLVLVKDGRELLGEGRDASVFTFQVDSGKVVASHETDTRCLQIFHEVAGVVPALDLRLRSSAEPRHVRLDGLALVVALVVKGDLGHEDEGP